VFAFFWLLIVVCLELIALGPLFIFFFALIGAAGAGEMIPEYDYAAKDYRTPGSRPTDFECLLGLQCSMLALYLNCMLMNLAPPI
jgi:hypothetical protein